ncbi:hypothetical protein MC885_015875 [Smutsia gigantea]|nr:hypothetical protein MC885_015875 [Smutsia gigantea]
MAGQVTLKKYPGTMMCTQRD